ncbi:MAG: arylesterase [Rhodanobacteraceae bacterium]|jgi:acyl-CoA thioesterase-1|nr:arylesterase [Rhodanobacteraceae bacterium]
MLLAWCAAASAASSAPILVLGDSLSAAYRLPTSEGWVALLERRLADNNLQRPVVNASISGETTAGGLARLPALLAEHKPALVVVELGANDALRGLPLAQVRANLTQTLTAIRAAGARAVLLGIEMPPNYGTPYRDGLRAMYRDLAAEFNAPLLPFLLDGVAQDPALMQGDGLHPTAAGQPKVLDNVWPVLAPALKALPARAPAPAH